MSVCSDELSQWAIATSNSEGVPFRFSTDGVSPPHRIAAWREVLRRVYVPLDVAALDDASFCATIEQHSCSSSSLCFIETSAVSMSRTPSRIDGNEAVLL